MATACGRRGRKAEAHRRWESISDTIDLPCGVFPDHEALALCRNNDVSHAAAAGPPKKTRQNDSDDRRGRGTDVSDVRCGLQDSTGGHDSTRQGSESRAADDDDEVYPDNIEDFMATLLDGMKSDSVQLATSARNVVANTYQVVVRPWEAVTRMAAPFLSSNPDYLIQPSRENTRRGHELLDNALSLRVPGAIAAGRPRHGNSSGEQGGKGGGTGDGALQAIDGNSPPRSTPASPPRGRSRSAAGTKRGRGAQRRGRLGAVKLEVTPPKSRGDGESGGCCDFPSAAEPAAEGRRRSQTPPPSASPLGEAGRGGGGGGGGILRRMSLSASPPRRGLAGALARVLPFGGGEKERGASLCRAVANPAAGLAAAATATGSVEAAPRRRGAVAEGSRIDLRGLDRAKGGNRPRAYHCKDRSVVVLGRERMLSVLPDDGDSGGGSGGGSGSGSGSGVVTWVLRYTELESCCINVSAGKESECSVGDVIVEVTTRPSSKKENAVSSNSGGSSGGGSGGISKPGRRSFCLTNPSECLELLQSIQIRWQPSSSSSSASGTRPPPPSSSPLVPPSSQPRVTGVDPKSSGNHAATSMPVLAASPPKTKTGSNSSSSSPNGGGENGSDAGHRNGGGSGGGGSRSSVASRGPEGGGEARSPAAGRSPPGSRGARGGAGEGVAPSPFSGVKRGVIILESPAKMLRDQLKERHEQHERGLKEDLELRHQSSKASLLRRRQQMRRRSVSQSPCSRGARSGFDPSPLVMPPSMLPPAAGAAEAVKSAGPDLTKYRNMKTAGVPEAAIRHKMAMDRVDASYAELVFSPSPAPGAAPAMLPPPPPPPPPLPPGMLYRGLSDKSLALTSGLRLAPLSPAGSSVDPISSCRSEGGGFFGGRGGGGAAAPPDTPRRTSKPLLNLHWDVLPPAKIERTVWAKRRGAAAAAAATATAAGDGAATVSMDDAEIQELEKLFSKKSAKDATAGRGGWRRSTLDPETAGTGQSGGGGSGGGGGGRRDGKARRGGGGAAASGRAKKVSLLDVSRGNNVAIGLKAFKRLGGVSELARLVGGLDAEESLTVEDLQRLEACLPTAQELKTVLAYTGPPAALGPAETFFRALQDTPRAGGKVTAMLFSRQFLGSVAGDAESRVETLRMACEEAMSSDRLASVLEKVLDIGNLLNEGTYQGNACGFRISSLLKLSHTKSHSDKKTTVLHYIVRTIAAKERSAAATVVATRAPADSGLVGSSSAEPEAPAAAAAAAVSASSSSSSSSSPPSPASSRSPPDCATPTKKILSRSPAAGKAWPGGAPPGCRGNRGGGGGGGTKPSPPGGRRGVAGRAGTSSGGGGRRRGGAAVLVRVEGLDLQEELRHVREAAKVPVGEILMDLRQARKGLRQVKGELQRVRDDEAKKKAEEEEEDGVGAAAEAGTSVAGGGKRKEALNPAASASAAAAAATAAAPTRLYVVSEGSERSTSTSTTSSSSCPSPPLPAESSCSAEGGEEKSGAPSPGVLKLSAFVEKAEARLSSIERSANACVGLCKDLGEYFGEGADEAQAHHIFRTLVQFLDLLQEAKKAEGLC